MQSKRKLILILACNVGLPAWLSIARADITLSSDYISLSTTSTVSSTGNFYYRSAILLSRATPMFSYNYSNSFYSASSTVDAIASVAMNFTGTVNDEFALTDGKPAENSGYQQLTFNITTSSSASVVPPGGSSNLFAPYPIAVDATTDIESSFDSTYATRYVINYSDAVYVQPFFAGSPTALFQLDQGGFYNNAAKVGTSFGPTTPSKLVTGFLPSTARAGTVNGVSSISLYDPVEANGPYQYTYGWGSAGGAVTASVTLQELPPVEFFGIGVNWAGLAGPDGKDPLQFLEPVRGDKDVANLQAALNTTPVFTTDPSLNAGVPINANASGGTALSTIASRFSTFAAEMNGSSNHSHDTVVIYLSSHGGPTSGLLLSSDQTYLQAATIEADLAELPSTTRKILIVDSCYGGYWDQVASAVTNTCVFASSQVGTSPYNPSDGTGIWSDRLEQDIDGGDYDLEQLQSDLNTYTYQGLGTVLPTLDTFVDEATFTGIDTDLTEGPGFSGDLYGPGPAVVPEPAGLAGLLMGGTALLRRWGK